MEEYTTVEVKTTKRNADIFNWIEQARDEEKQLKDYVIQKLGNAFSKISIYPKKRKKFPCPQDCGNTYIWLTEKYINKDAQILQATCACCDEIFLIYQKKEKAVRVSNSFNNNSGRISFKA